ncbi:metallophosphoesterase [Novosphingobium sp.]|uniref:metallophosphoesterase n=1 Tax=Novosphingobium sp. TaxID=1874826 RepID=UPI00261421B4|nr:metallophosphoesterase [Novosphingobium sp.]
MRNLLRARGRDKAATPSIPPGQRVYAVGDVHGRLDLFAPLMARIEQDDADRGPAETTIVLLGDLIDRGPDSAAVVAAARALAARRRVRLLTGNHEEMLLRAMNEADVLRPFLRHGGRETLLSYPLNPHLLDTAEDYEVIRLAMRAAIPADDIAYLQQGEAMVRVGDYLFVHAGIQPGVALDAQSEHDLRWIRQPFLSHAGDHGCVVVHGHTIAEDVEVRANRIGIDTGAFYTGRLTALALEGTSRWLIETRLDPDGGVSCHSRSVE